MPITNPGELSQDICNIGEGELPFASTRGVGGGERIGRVPPIMPPSGAACRERPGRDGLSAHL